MGKENHETIFNNPDVIECFAHDDHIRVRIDDVCKFTENIVGLEGVTIENFNDEIKIARIPISN